ncbi:MAG TPA: ATP-binding protein [Ktedonobacteraceae bacterium]|nr:ATP-binding protein [Ktedonobacteraceae bacterium]
MSGQTFELQMKIVATEKLTRAYLQKLGRQNYLAAASSIGIITISFIWLLFRLGGDTAVTFVGDSMYGVASWIGAWWAFTTAWRARYGPVRLQPRLQLAWLLIGAGLITNGIGGFYYTYLEMGGTLTPVPSPADIGFTMYYLFALAGLLLIPTQPHAGRFRLRIGLDALITTLCLLGISWYFVIYPIFLNETDTYKLIVAVSYPFWDILLILALLLLFYQRTERILRASLILFGLGIVSQICADTGYAIGVPAGTYTTGTFYVDTFWFIGYLLMGLAALYQYNMIVRKVYNERQNTDQAPLREDIPPNLSGKSDRSYTLFRNLLLYIPLAILLILMLYSETTEDNTILSFFLVVLTAILGVLVSVRYVLTSNENEMLLREREQRSIQADHLRMLAAQLAPILELDPLLTRIITIAANQLGFDAAILVLLGDYDSPLSRQSSLQVLAATSGAAEINTWEIHAEHLVEQVGFLGKEMAVQSTAPTSGLPIEIRQWQQDHGIPVTLFVPLRYQNKIIGSLGLSRSTSEYFGPHDSYLANAFAELAASAIEHAHLYQSAREHEGFARALANIAARLNSAVAEPAEIHQFICIEAANALQADYALLYSGDTNRQLLPLAYYVDPQEPPATFNDWPPIYQRDFEMQALGSLQPILMAIEQRESTGKLPAISGQFPAILTSRSNPSLPAISGRAVPEGFRGRGARVSSLREALQRRYVRTAILAPLIAKDTPVALLVLARSLRTSAQKKKSFVIADLAQAQDFAEQAAIAFTNAQLYFQLHTAHKRLQELDQLKDQFMITASHELRTPLTAVQGYLELLVQYGDALPAEQRQEFLQKAQRGCEELVILLSNVMDASRLEVEAGIRPAHIERVSVQEVIRNILDLIEPQAKKENRALYVHIPAKLFVQADPGRLRQVFLNLSVNALKYSPEGTPVTFYARIVQDPQPAAIISVADKGKGIKPQDQAKLFQRFVRLEDDLNSTVRGSGLGLYISRRLIEAMGGQIWIESSGIPGTGTIFHVRLPLA